MPRKPNKNFKQINRYDWKKIKDWEYPYKGNTLSDTQYIEDKNKLFKINGNGWWCNDGRGWNPNIETPMERMERYRREKNELQS